MGVTIQPAGFSIPLPVPDARSYSRIETLIRATPNLLMYLPLSTGLGGADDGDARFLTGTLIATPAYTTPTTEITMMAWAKKTGTVNQVQSVIRQETGGAFVILCYAAGATITPKHIISTDGGAGGGLTAGVVNDANWHMYAFTWKKNTTSGWRVFVDGALSTSSNATNADLPANTNGIGIGISPAGFGEAITGNIAHAAVFGRALTDQEIADVYHAGLDPW